MDKSGLQCFTLVKDKDCEFVKHLNMHELLEFMKTNPVTRKRITYKEYESYRNCNSIYFDTAKAFYYLAGGYRIALEMELIVDNVMGLCYLMPEVEEAMLYGGCPSYFPEDYDENCML